MTRLFGCICNQPERFKAVVEPVRAALIARAPVARWGLGYVHSSEVLLLRNPRVSETDVDLFEALEGLSTDYAIAATSPADGLKGNANTQPYRFRRWMWAMDGTVDKLDEVGPQILEFVPEYLRRNIKGKTASEMLFHLFLAMLHDAGRMDHPNLEPLEGSRALRDALAFTFSQITRAGGAKGPGNIIVTNSRFMLAVRLDAPLFVRQYREHIDPKRAESQLKAVLTLDCDENPGEGFEEVPQRQVIAVHRNVLSEIIPLD